MTHTAPRSHHRLEVLDGWRALSIAGVLAAHLLPLGPHRWELNHAAGLFGMVLFFNLSGFLITRALLKDDRILPFLIRRGARILPLAWAFLGVITFTNGLTPELALRHFSFTANLPPHALTLSTGHFWSLCLEVQFYAGIALLVGLMGRKVLWALPLVAASVTALRWCQGAEVSITTWLRADEILAGVTLALLYHEYEQGNLKWLARINPFYIWPFLLLSCHPLGGFLNYLRPYLAMALVGASLANGVGKFRPLFASRPAKYVAEVSFALYVVHPYLADTWLGSGQGWEKYFKRPLLLITIFLVAHVSTRYFERWFMDWGRRLASR